MVGNESVKRTDYFDVNMISIALPFVDYIAVDNSMRNRLNKLKLAQKYKCNVIKKDEIGSILQNLAF